MSRTVLLAAVLALLSAAALLLGHGFLRTASEPGASEASLISPVSGRVDNRNLSIGARAELKEHLQAYATESAERGAVHAYGIYFRELISGPAIAINEDQSFLPASLLKLPVALWYYKQAEADPGLLGAEIDFHAPQGESAVRFPPEETLVPGGRYTIRDLIRFMLVESDNEATHILVEHAGGREAVNALYADLGFTEVADYGTYTLDTQTYVGFFRVLYDTDYLSPEASAEVLSMLAASSFRAGLVAGLPAGVTVAHKFGERAVSEDGSVVQLHDCGIVYAPHNPYLVCVMTQGASYDDLARFIADVSRRIYEVVSATP